jgi:hypothetical protein
MRRWFLSYNSQDLALTQAFEEALRRKDAEAQVFFAPKSLRAGGYWLKQLADEIAQANAFVLLIGEKGLVDGSLMNTARRATVEYQSSWSCWKASLRPACQCCDNSTGS